MDKTFVIVIGIIFGLPVLGMAVESCAKEHSYAECVNVHSPAECKR